MPTHKMAPTGVKKSAAGLARKPATRKPAGSRATGTAKSAAGRARKPAAPKAKGMAKKATAMSYKGVGAKGKGKGMMKRNARAK